MTKSEKPSQTAKSGDHNKRSDRLAAELRANLKRRKSAARARKAPSGETVEDDGHKSGE